MNDLPRKLLLGLVLLFIAVSVIMPSIIYFKYSDSVKPSNSYASATVSLSVSTGICGDNVCEGIETCSSCAADCGACPSVVGAAGGGGGAGAAVDYETHLLDFTEEESYTISPKRGDKLKIILDFGLEYNFDVSGFVSRSSLLLSYEAESYEIGYYEMGYFDLTGDEINDIVISFVDGASLKIVSLYSPVSVTPDDKFSPVLEKEKIKYPLVVPGLEIGLNLIFIFVLIALAVLIVFIYHHLKLKRLEKTQGKSVVKIYHTYRKSRKSKEDKIKMKGKLNKQLMLLVKAHKSGYVSKQSYLKGRARINDLIRKL